MFQPDWDRPNSLSLALVLLVVALTAAGCGTGQTKNDDVKAVESRYMKIVGDTNEADSLPFLANELTIEVAVDLFGTSLSSSVVVNPYDFLQQFRMMQTDIQGFLFDSVSTSLVVSPNWSDAVVSVNGTEATVTRSYQVSYSSDVTTITGTGATETYWSKVSGEWKLYKLRHTATWSQQI